MNKKRKPIQVTIESILDRFGLKGAFNKALNATADDPYIFHAEIRTSGFLPLVIRVLEPGIVSLCHYGMENGVLMQDPEIEFRDWLAISFYNAYTGLYQPRTNEKRYNASANVVARIWARNLRNQGFVDDSTCHCVDSELMKLVPAELRHSTNKEQGSEIVD